MHVRNPLHVPKGHRNFSDPFIISKKFGEGTYKLSNGDTWNASHLTAFPDTTAVPSSTDEDTMPLSSNSEPRPIQDTHQPKRLQDLNVTLPVVMQMVFTRLSLNVKFTNALHLIHHITRLELLLNTL